VADPALRFLEYVFLALLYLFFLRVLRAVWVELREPRVVPAETTQPHDQVAGDDAGQNGSRKDGSRRNGSRKERGLPHQLAVMSAHDGTGDSFALANELTIGRSTDCAVPLPDDNFVSQVHARVFRREDEYWVEDLGSTNGTLMNGRKLSGPAPVRRGDRLQVGRTVLELRK
jgi:pSer/pThr/pTyr-binding forkhead associated (FHA) protein